MNRKYESAAAFKQALEHRLKAMTPAGTALARTRQLAVFDRFLARVAELFGDSATVKGGVALELRLERARTTKDVDLRMMGSAADLLDRLREAGRVDLDDFFAFEIEPDPHHPSIEAEGMKYDGMRFRAECKLAGKLYGQRFGIDVAFGDPVLGEPDIVLADDVFAFAGIAPAKVRIYPVETHVAEKLHAYTLPRDRPSSRVRDLPDLALLATTRPLEAARLRAAIAQTFGFRGTHAPPTELPAPPASWREPYAAMAAEDALAWPVLDDVFAAARAFLDPVLSPAAVTTWQPSSARWDSSP